MSNIVKYTSELPDNKDQFLKTHLPIKCIKTYSKILTPLDAAKTESVSLAKLKTTYSEDWTLAYIELWIVNLNEFLNISRPMNEPQIKETAFYLLSKYYYLKLTDITLVFNKIKSGEFGQLYEGIDGVKILSWFEKYANERIQSFYDDGNRIDEKYKTDDYPRTNDASSLKEGMAMARGFNEILKDKRINSKNISINK